MGRYRVYGALAIAGGGAIWLAGPADRSFWFLLLALMLLLTEVAVVSVRLAWRRLRSHEIVGIIAASVALAGAAGWFSSRGGGEVDLAIGSCFGALLISFAILVWVFSWRRR